MSPRNTGIVFLVATALAAFVYFYEIEGSTSRKRAEEQAKQLFPEVELDAIDWLELTSEDGSSVRLERREGGWELTQPLRFPADSFAADGIASAIARLSSDVVLDSPGAPETYGLADSTREIRFGTDDAEHSLRIGDKTPMGANTYASIGDSDAVYTVSTSATLAFRKSLDDLRNKRIAEFDRSTIQHIALSWRGGRVTLEREDGAWALIEPLHGPADETVVDALLSDLSFLRATGFVDDPPPDEEVGLDVPAFAAELTGATPEEGGEASTLRVTIGGNVDGKSRLVRSSGPSLYRIAAERIDDFPRDVVAYRFRELSKFSMLDAERIEILFHPQASTDDGPVSIEGSRGDAGWSASPDDFRPGKLSRLISELSRLRAEDIVAESMGPDELAAVGLSPPNASFSVFGEAGEGEAELFSTVHIGVVRGENGIVARTPGSDVVFALDYELAEHIPVSLEAFRNRFEAEAAQPEDPPTDATDSEPDAPL